MQATFATAPAHTVSLGPLRRPHWSGSTFTTLYPPSRSAQQLQPSRNTAATIVPKRHLPASSYAPPTRSALVCLGEPFSLLRALRTVLPCVTASIVTCGLLSVRCTRFIMLGYSTNHTRRTSKGTIIYHLTDLAFRKNV